MKYTVAASESERPGASAGSQVVSAAPMRATARLLSLCDELAQCQAEIDRLSLDGAPPDDLDAVLNAWWATVEAITSKPAKSFLAMQSKARAVHTVMLAVGRDRSPEVSALLASLLSDILGEAVELP